MIFRDFLKEILDQVDGGIAATLMADDGVNVADFVTNDKSQVNLQNVAIEFSQILKQVGSITAGMLDGGIEELVASTKDYSMVFFPVHENYFVALLMQRHGNLGKGRYLLKKYRSKFVEQL